MDSECRVQLDVTDRDGEVREEPTPGVQARSKLTKAVLVLTVCLAAAAALLLVFYRQHNVKLHHTLRQMSHVRAAIHLQGVHNPKMTNSVEWQDEVEQTHSQGGLKLDNNEVVIPHHGLYFVYSQVSFQVSCGDADVGAVSSPQVHLSHTVQRWSSSFGSDKVKSYRTILHSARTVCQKTASADSADEGSSFAAVYMGAVFNLLKGDRLRTVMEENMLPFLEDDPGKSFFGVFAL
uniref:Tumor necrosis factor a (TNF superfamily, member 2) n=1 Tax=Cynoglossus semilaevis TaxID=244447 RepID=A0A3P8WS65_CYNSE